MKFLTRFRDEPASQVVEKKQEVAVAQPPQLRVVDQMHKQSKQKHDSKLTKLDLSSSSEAASDEELRSNFVSLLSCFCFDCLCIRGDNQRQCF